MGWKTTLRNGMLRFNGAVYQQDWDSFQFSFLGVNSFTVIQNGPNARIRGVEMDANVNTGPLALTVAGSYTDAKTRQNLCLGADPTFTCTGTLDSGQPNMVSAPAGTRLPITPQFKITGTARYTVPLGASAKGYIQALVSHQSSAASDIRLAVYAPGTGDVINPAAQLGRLQAYTTGNLAVGAEIGSNYTLEVFAQNLWDERGEISRFQACGTCGDRPYIVPIQPRTIGIRAGAKF